MFAAPTFEQASPALTALRYIAKMQQQRAQTQNLNIQNQYLPQGLAEQNRGLGIGNDLKDVQLQYAPQMTQAQLAQLIANTKLTGAQTGEANARIPLYGAQADLARQQAAFYPYETAAKFDDITKLKVGKQFSDWLAQRGAGGGGNAPGLQSTNGGFTVQPAQPSLSPATLGGGLPTHLTRLMGAQGDPNQAAAAANYPVLPGGTPNSQIQQAPQAVNAPTQTQQPQQQGVTAPQGGGNSLYDNLYAIRTKNLLNQLTKDPTMGSLRSGAGGSYTNTDTGQQFSTDTTKNITTDQAAIAAIDRVKPLLDSLSKNLSPFQTLKGQGALRLGQVQNIFGGNSAIANQYAKGQADLKIASESLLKGWGLNVTNESLQTMQEAVKPRFGESPQGYKDRIKTTLAQLSENQRQAASRLKGGTNLDTAGQGEQTAQISIPSFSHKGEFQSWYQKLSPEQKAQVKTQLQAGV